MLYCIFGMRLWIYNMIKRDLYLESLKKCFEIFPVCALLGPRQCGKTTLALEFKKLFKESYHFDLEDPTDLERLENPKLALDPLSGLIVIDEVQRKPELFPYLRVLVDKKPDTKLLILGSASRDLLKQSSESLAGRIHYTEMTPFNLKETNNLQLLWTRGGFPRSYLATTEENSHMWRKSYISTFLERDLASLGFNLSPQLMRKLWTMLAHYHGNIINYTEFARSLGVTDKTIKTYVDILEGAFMVRSLKPWFANIKKRQVKAPKIYIRDSGLLHTLLGLGSENITMHPKVGASWEGFALEEVIIHMKADSDDCFYWRTQTGVELDLLVFKDEKRYGFEFKYTDSPKATKSMHIAKKDLNLDTLIMIIPGNKSFHVYEDIIAIGLDSLDKDLQIYLN